MNTFKKIYIAIVIMTLVSWGYLCLTSIGLIEYNILDETSRYIMTSATNIAIMSILFSRSANVIANRKNRIIGYLATFIGLLNLLLVALSMITKADFLTDASEILGYITIYMFLLVMVFEVPQANSMHGTYQKVLAVIISFTIIFPYISGLKEIELFKKEESITTLDSYLEKEEEIESKITLTKINSALIFISIAGFVINPMYRVYYIDKDYQSSEEVNDILENAHRVKPTDQVIPNQITRPTNSQMGYSNQYQNQYSNQNQNLESMLNNVPMTSPVAMPSPVVSEIGEVKEPEIKEKVVNEKFQQETHPEAIIPMIAGETSQTETVAEAQVVTPTVSQEASPTPVEIPQETPQPEKIVEPIVAQEPVEESPKIVDIASVTGQTETTAPTQGFEMPPIIDTTNNNPQ